MIRQVTVFSIEIIVTLLLTIIALLVIKIFDLDFYFADLIYSVDNTWTYTRSWLYSTLIHNYAKKFIILLFLIFLSHIIYVLKTQKGNENIRPKVILIFAIVAGTLTVSILKVFFDVDCPWDLIKYGGEKPFFELFNYDSKYLPSSRCFPAAHASVGFTLISIYFYCRIHCQKYKYPTFILALTIGFTFGFAQQMRGAHFLSHTLWSLIICITVNIIIYATAYRKNTRTTKVYLNT